MMRNRLLGVCLFLGVVFGAQGEPLSVGITPLKPAARLAEEWTPLLDEVAKRAGLELRFRTATSIPAYGERLEKGEYDIAYMNPYDYQLYSASPGYRAFVRERGQPLEGLSVNSIHPCSLVTDRKNRHGSSARKPKTSRDSSHKVACDFNRLIAKARSQLVQLFLIACAQPLAYAMMGA